jgi:signal transduction histidine kinase
VSLSITWRARLLSGSLSALALIALVFLAQSRIRAVLYDSVDDALRAQAQGLIRDPRFTAWGQPRMPGEEGPEPFRPGGGDPQEYPGGPLSGEGEPPPMNRRPRRRPPPPRFARMQLLMPRRIPLEYHEGDPQPPEPWSAAGLKAAQATREDLRDEVNAQGEPMRVFSVRLPDSVLQTASLLDGTESALQDIKNALYTLLLPLSLLSFLLGALLTEVVLAPMRRIAKAAAAIEPDNLGARLPAPGGNDTFDHLVGGLNAMLGRLEDAFARQKRFTADASHELRTPLSVIKAATSFLLDGDTLSDSQRRIVTRADATADRANRLVSDLLLLARTENGARKTTLTETPLAPLLQEIVADAHTAHAAPHAPITLRVPDSATLTTDPDLLRRLVGNLLSNALRHTPETGSVSLTWHEDTLTVSDTGEGIPADALPRLGEPFFRPDAARARTGGGAGLGLALCKEIAQALGGELTIQSTIGEGTRITVCFANSQ